MNDPTFDTARADLDRLVALRSHQHHCSIAWGVVAKGELVVTGAHAADPDPLPTQQTVFRIASMTKSFTSSSILILRDRGLLRLDDRLADLAPEFAAVSGPTADSPAITLRHLMTMAAGLPSDDLWADRHLDMADDDLDALLAGGAAFAWSPGTNGEYSNLGFAMLGRIIRNVSGRRAQDFITENLLTTLGMERTTWVQPDHDDWVRPFDVDADKRVADIEPLADGAIAPMGGLWSCITDLAKWVTWFADAFPARDGDDSGPLCRASRREMQQVQRAWPTEHTLASGEGDDAVPERIDGGGYGYGLFVRHDTRFGHFVHHSGGLPGYGSNMRWLPERGIGVIALGNSTYAPMSVVTRRMMEILDDHGLVPSRPRPPDTVLMDAAQRLSVLLSDWTDREANDLFADNIALDEPFDRRAVQAAKWVAEHGTLTLVDVDASTPLRGRVVMRHADGTERRFDVEMSPHPRPRLQLYEAVTG